MVRKWAAIARRIDLEKQNQKLLRLRRCAPTHQGFQEQSRDAATVHCSIILGILCTYPYSRRYDKQKLSVFQLEGQGYKWCWETGPSLRVVFAESV